MPAKIENFEAKPLEPVEIDAIKQGFHDYPVRAAFGDWVEFAGRIIGRPAPVARTESSSDEKSG